MGVTFIPVDHRSTGYSSITSLYSAVPGTAVRRQAHQTHTRYHVRAYTGTSLYHSKPVPHISQVLHILPLSATVGLAMNSILPGTRYKSAGRTSSRVREALRAVVYIPSMLNVECCTRWWGDMIAYNTAVIHTPVGCPAGLSFAVRVLVRSCYWRMKFHTRYISGQSLYRWSTYGLRTCL